MPRSAMPRGRLSRALGLVAALALLPLGAGAAGPLPVTVGYLSVARPAPPLLTELDRPPEGLGRDGARLGLADNATTGRFLGHDWRLSERAVALGDDPLPVARAALAESPLLVVDAAPDALLAIADLPEAVGAVIVNATEGAVALRDSDCRANLLHVAPSLAMRTDALAQFLAMRRWADLVLVEGAHPDDRAYAAALEASLGKFGLRIRDRRAWTFDADMRRNAAQEVPLFTQGFGDYDALLIADEIGDFGRFLAYNTWEPRPVAGSEGLVATAWAPMLEQWGAAQLQTRFREMSGRPMEAGDWGGWAAVRALGEAVTRTGAADPAALRDFMLSDGFELAGFKGEALSFRPWNGQLRQPVPLVQPRALVAQAPLEGFLHQVSELDTLGLDRADSACTAFGG